MHPLRVPLTSIHTPKVRLRFMPHHTLVYIRRVPIHLIPIQTGQHIVPFIKKFHCKISFLHTFAQSILKLDTLPPLPPIPLILYIPILQKVFHRQYDPPIINHQTTVTVSLLIFISFRPDRLDLIFLLFTMTL
jgi:hypothetical protein